MNIADNEEVLEFAAKAGCRMIFIGVEAESTDALAELGKKLNLKIGVNSYEEAFQRINHHGIAVFGAFIGGMDVDTLEKMCHRTNYALHSKGINIMQFTYLTPLPGTRLFNRLQNEGRLLHTKFPDDWSRYDLTEVVYKPTLMTPQELSAIGVELIHRSCSRYSIWRKFFQTWYATRSLITAIWAYRYNTAFRDIAFAVTKQGREKDLTENL